MSINVDLKLEVGATYELVDVNVDYEMSDAGIELGSQVMLTHVGKAGDGFVENVCAILIEEYQQGKAILVSPPPNNTNKVPTTIQESAQSQLELIKKTMEELQKQVNALEGYVKKGLNK